MQINKNRRYRGFTILEIMAVVIIIGILASMVAMNVFSKVDEAKVKAEERFDGKFVLRTNTALSNGEVALQYKRLQMVEQFFRAIKSVMETRPIFHQWDMTITGHVFSSFLALVLVDELQRRMQSKGWQEEWAVVRRDLEALAEVEVRQEDKWYLLRTSLVGVAGKVLQAAGVAVPPPIRPSVN